MSYTLYVICDSVYTAHCKQQYTILFIGFHVVSCQTMVQYGCCSLESHPHTGCCQKKDRILPFLPLPPPPPPYPWWCLQLQECTKSTAHTRSCVKAYVHQHVWYLLVLFYYRPFNLWSRNYGTFVGFPLWSVC